MLKNEKGFSVVAIVLVILALGIFGGSGWYVWQKQNDKSASNSISQTTDTTQVNHTDSSKTFSIQYPSSWSVLPYEAPGYDGPVRPEPDWTKTPQSITLSSQSNKKAEIHINGHKDADTTIDKEIGAINQDQFNSYSKVTINGYEAVKHVLDFVGPSDAEKYKDTVYIVLYDGNKVELKFRERYSNTTTNGENDFDVTSLVPDFEQAVNSIKYLH